MPIPEWFYSNTGYATVAVMDCKCWQIGIIPTTRLYQLWVTMVRLLFTNGLLFFHQNGSLFPLSDPPDFGLSSNAGQFLSGSIADPGYATVGVMV